VPGDFGYTIHITPGPQGEFTFYRQEGLNQPLTWTETFKPDEVELAKFYGIMVEKGLFTRQWKPRLGVNADGGQECLAVTMLGQDYTIPGQLEPEEAALANEMYIALESLIPPEIWVKFMAEHERFGPVYRP
jgi:hypothetical protein